MIAQIRGIVTEINLTSVIVDVNGIGYQIFIPMSTYDKLSGINKEISLLTHLHVREDAMLLYGFATGEEKQLFESLITVSGIGAKVALNILSCMPVSTFCSAVVGNDLKTITSINGVGKKTAERLVIEMRDKVQAFATTLLAEDTTEDELGQGAIDALLALEQLGFKKERADKVLRGLTKVLPTDECSSENLIRKALQKLNS